MNLGSQGGHHSLWIHEQPEGGQNIFAHDMGGQKSFHTGAFFLNQGDAEGFIKLNALRLRVGARRKS